MPDSKVLKKIMVAVTVIFWALLAAPAHAVTIGFTDFMAPDFWQSQGDLGNIYFAQNDTELHIEGPTGLATPFQSSADGISYVGPNGNGAPRSGTLSFQFYFDAGDALNAQADISVTTSEGTQVFTFAAGGAGTVLTGNFVVSLDEHSVFTLLLSTLNPSGDKTPGRLVITGMEFQSVPDGASTALLLGAAFVLLGVHHHRSTRRRLASVGRIDISAVGLK